MTLTRTSRYISLILRHKPETIGITLDEHGWANVDELIAGVSRTHPLTMELLQEIVRTDEKQRYSFNEDRTLIRANQGHSVSVDVELPELKPPAILYHGTGQKYVESIDRQLFQQLYYQADVIHGGRLPVHVHFVMDEFANVALPDEFDTLLATMRSREISVSIIIQNLDVSYPVEITGDGAVIEVEIENTRIRGTVQLTKVDEDYPDNKLSGAEFDVYRDSNGNKELDAGDELVGVLTEVSTGVYEMDGVEFGGHFVKERTAPEGFYLDENAYYFEVSAHNELVVVENKAGTGFVNAAQVGSLKIVKTSSDKKVEGFSFRVTGPNGYEQVFTTNADGEILIEGLRIGEYRVSEVLNEKSANYITFARPTIS